MIMISKKKKNPDSPLVSGWPCCSVLSASPFKTSKIPPRGLSYQVKADCVQPLATLLQSYWPQILTKKIGMHSSTTTITTTTTTNKTEITVLKKNSSFERLTKLAGQTGRFIISQEQDL
jgi:hypothetical protein